jgi:hypothetical protein
MLTSSKPIVIKSTGGTTAQLLGLCNALYLSSKFNRPFKFLHNNFSTGTFRPFELIPLLGSEEYVLDNNRPEANNTTLKTGDLISLNAHKKNLLTRKIRKIFIWRFLFKSIKVFQREYSIKSNQKNLMAVKKNVKSLSGNFVPYLDNNTYELLKVRFQNSKLPNPFHGEKVRSDLIVIHVRLGDMRKMASRIPGIGGHGIINPVCYLNLLSRFEVLANDSKICVISDEPKLATKLLNSVGLKAQAISNNSVWEDLKAISQARWFIGCMSQFSFFGGMVCDFNGGDVFLPSQLPDGLFDTKDNFSHHSFNYYLAEYLPDDHWIFQDY